MTRWRTLLLLLLFAAADLALAATPAELFQKAKGEYSGGSYAAALATLQQLETESARPENAFIRQQLEPALAFYRGACLAQLGKRQQAVDEFEKYLTMQPNATLDKAVHPAKTFAAFEEAREAIAKRPTSNSLATSFAVFVPSAARAPVDEKWADGAVKHLMTADERREWTAQSTPADREAFVTKFWAGRARPPGSPTNQNRDEFEKRAAFADSQFGQDDTAGSLTDRGMVFVLLGPPTYVGRKPFTTEDAAAPTLGGAGLLSSRLSGGASVSRGQSPDSESWREVWHYRKEILPPGTPYQLVDVEFLTKKGYGKNVLQREPATLSTLEIARKKP
jgi:GWxTD domain-containing protein